MEVACPSEISTEFQLITQRYITEVEGFIKTAVRTSNPTEVGREDFSFQYRSIKPVFLKPQAAAW
jgi:hypothetical protein